ncbi:MAG TPA: malto-oligosyltrehalose synthase, partial [Gemmatimonadaceae bacterium]
MTPPRPLLATYRLQLNRGFTLRHAARIVPYLHQLGVSHIYSSPITTARPGSTHGYDVVDPRALNPELGTEGDLRALARALHERGMGLVVDIVPNHMGTGSENPYWDDVLALGQASRFAPWFDIDWYPPERSLAGRILLPVLGRSRDAAIAREEITLARADGALRVRYFDHSFPLDPSTVPESLRRAADEGSDAVARYTMGRDGHRRLRALLDRQHYVLANWRRAARDINYRRFFNINELVALRVEDEAVFRATHERILLWVADGTLDGLRVDHIDGLLDPRTYLERLRSAVATARGRSAGGGSGGIDNAGIDTGGGDDAGIDTGGGDQDGDAFPIVVEKILCEGEQLRADWPVQGTTGYEFLNELESVFIDAGGKERIEARYRAMLHLGRAVDFEEVAYRGKVHVLRASLAPDVDRVHRLLQPIAQRDPRARDLPASVVRDAIVELIACFPVYRTYIDARTEVVHPEDQREIDIALERARERGVVPRAVLDLLEDVLLLRLDQRGQSRLIAGDQ